MNLRLHNNHALWFGWALAGLFFLYYSALSNQLPLGAGPDAKANDDVTAFIVKHGRLAILPEDEDKLSFTPYGGTRATRPPLAYLVSALMVTLADNRVSNPESTAFRLAARKGSALLVALAVTVLFQAFRLYSNSTVASTLLALIVGLMPQWTFIGTYNNDDSAALLAGALVLFSLLRLYRFGPVLSNAVWLGFAAGITILSKPTAWLLLPMLALSALLLTRTTLRDWLQKAALALLVLLLVGGWWPLWNMVHLGWDDPLQVKVVQRVASRHARLNPALTFSYSDKGVGAAGLVLHNQNQFLTKAFVSTVGNLDWLRIRVGPLQYRFYGLLFLLAFFLLLIMVIKPPSSSDTTWRQNLLGVLLLLGLLTQLGGYLFANLYNDIQEQGKYLLPALGLLLLPLLPVLQHLHESLARQLRRWPASHLSLHSRCHFQSFVLLLLIVALVHLQALISYVIPYYWPQPHRLQVRRMLPFEIRVADILKRNDISELQINNRRQLQITASGPDPWFVLPGTYCNLLQGPNVLFRVRLQAEQRGTFSLLWEQKPGAGFTADAQATARYRAGTSEFIMGLAKRDCYRLRIDPINHSGTIRIIGMAAVRIDVDWPVAP